MHLLAGVNIIQILGKDFMAHKSGSDWICSGCSNRQALFQFENGDLKNLKFI